MKRVIPKRVYIFEFVPESYEGPLFDLYFHSTIGMPYVSRSKCVRIESSEDLARFFSVGSNIKALRNSQYIHISSHGGIEPDTKAGSWGEIECNKCGKLFDLERTVDGRQWDDDVGLLCPECAGLKSSYVRREQIRELRRRRSVRALRLPYGMAHWSDFPMDCFEGKTVTVSACLMGHDATISYYNDQRWRARYVIAPKYEIYFDDSLLWYLNFYYLVLRHDYSTLRAYKRCDKFLSSKVNKEIGVRKGQKQSMLGGFRLFDFPEW